MSILVDRKTRLIVQGMTGREGLYHTERMIEYGTNVVAGVTPGKGGQTALGIPVYGTVREAAEETGANATILFVPAARALGGLIEAIEARIPLIVTVAEHVPVQDMMIAYHEARAAGVRIVGPNSFGVISPGKAKAGFMAHRIFMPGPVALLSRSATNCYEAVSRLTARGIGQSTCVGVGGDRIAGSEFADLLPMLQADAETELIVLIGEIGGDQEERAAEVIKAGVTKPVIALIAGKSAPKGSIMGHAGAIVGADGAGSAQGKEAALRAAGAHIAGSTGEIAELAERLLSR